jgi:cellulose synthase operon protein C
VIRFQRGFGGWTSQLQALHAQSWVVLLSDSQRDVPTLISAIHALGELAFAPPELLLPFAQDPRPPVRETAIRMLPWLDEGQGVPTLLECLGDDRARWAIYALRQAFAEMSRDRVLGHLRAAPTNKVTVAKEVMRLLGELGGQEAFDALLAVETRADLHRDVRIALLRALWDHLERDQTWPVFERAVTDKDWVVASRLADIPLGRLSAKSQERVLGLLVRVLSRPEPEARLDLLRRTPYLPITDTNRTLFTALVAALGAARPDEARTAALAVLARMQPGEVDQVAKRLNELSSRRQLMLELVPAFEPKTYSQPHVRKLAEQLAALLAADPLATVPYIRFASKLLPWKQLVALFKDLAQKNLLHADSMAAAADAIRHCPHPVQAEAALANEANPRLRRLGVEALRQAAAPQHGWTAERRQKLATYQADADPLVAGAAVYIFPPD